MNHIKEAVQHTLNAVAGLQRRLGATGHPDSDIQSASKGKAMARSCVVFNGWSYAQTAAPSFLNRSLKITNRAFEVITSADGICLPHLFDFIPEAKL